MLDQIPDWYYNTMQVGWLACVVVLILGTVAFIEGTTTGDEKEKIIGSRVILGSVLVGPVLAVVWPLTAVVTVVIALSFVGRTAFKSTKGL